MNLDQLKGANTIRWHKMHIIISHAVIVRSVAERLVMDGAKTKYLEVSEKTTVPWHVIAVIHEREASQSWHAGLAQGDPWNKVSIHIPRGIGPFSSWVDAAIYALEHCAPHAAANKDWSVGGTLTLLERYNGLGYAARDLPSPYIWASTDQYRSGKFIADGHYDPYAIDHQIGCAALLSAMMDLDKSIQFGEKV